MLGSEEASRLARVAGLRDHKPVRSSQLHSVSMYEIELEFEVAIEAENECHRRLRVRKNVVVRRALEDLGFGEPG